MKRLFNDEYVVWFKSVNGRLPKNIPTGIDENGDVLWVSRIPKSRIKKVDDNKIVEVMKYELDKEVKKIGEVVEKIEEKVVDLAEVIEKEVTEKIYEVVKNVKNKVAFVVNVTFIGSKRIRNYNKWLSDLKKLYREVRNGFWTKYDTEVMHFEFM